MGDAGYSGTPQLRKLGIVEGVRVHVVGRPAGWSFDTPLPAGVELDESPAPNSTDVVLAFVPVPAHLDPLHAWAEAVFPAGMVWVAWPRKAAGHVSDVDENLVRRRALAVGLVDVKVAAMDHDWSGLKLVWRKELRTR